MYKFIYIYIYVYHIFIYICTNICQNNLHKKYISNILVLSTTLCISTYMSTLQSLHFNTFCLSFGQVNILQVPFWQGIYVHIPTFAKWFQQLPLLTSGCSPQGQDLLTRCGDLLTRPCQESLLPSVLKYLLSRFTQPFSHSNSLFLCDAFAFKLSVNFINDGKVFCASFFAHFHNELYFGTRGCIPGPNDIGPFRVGCPGHP